MAETETAAFLAGYPLPSGMRYSVERVLLGCSAVGIYVLLAMSVNIISGYGRQLSLGQAAFAGLGAYTSALLHLRLALPFWLACPLSLLVAGCLGGLLGLPVLRSMRYYIPVMTLSANFLAQTLLRTGPLLGGYVGLGRIPPPRLFGVEFQPLLYFGLVIAAIGVCIVADRWLWHSPLGQRLRDATAMRADPPSASTRWAVLVAWSMSAAMAGLAGSLFAHLAAFISPFNFDVDTSLFILALAAFGGFGSLLGVILGAVLVAGVFEGVRWLAVYRLLCSGIILLLVGLWFPQGLLRAFHWPRVKSRVLLRQRISDHYG
jgi:branched-chain amino acid transport system permease protein